MIKSYFFLITFSFVRWIIFFLVRNDCFVPKTINILGNDRVYGDKLEFIKIDQTGKIYLPKIIRDKIDTKSKYLIITLPDGDVILHKIKRSKNPLRDFQKSWSTVKDISKVRKEIMAEAIKLAGERGD